VPVGDGETEVVIEREVELHDRASAAVDAIIGHTDGLLTKRIEVGAGNGRYDQREFASNSRESQNRPSRGAPTCSDCR